MSASELFRAGKLTAAIDAQIQKVKAQPADQSARLFLFELFLFAGEFDRARKQLDVLRYEKPEAEAAVQSYRKALDAEAIRRTVLRGGARPKFIKEMPAHAELRLEAIARFASAAISEGNDLLDRANEESPEVQGRWNGSHAEGIRDADELFGIVLEVIAGAEYCWVPLEQIASVEMNPVEHPRDVIWRPAHLTLIDGPEGDVLLPGLYPASHENADETIRLGRVTDWLGAEDVPARGVGGRLFTVSGNWVRFVEWSGFSSQQG